MFYCAATYGWLTPSWPKRPTRTWQGSRRDQQAEQDGKGAKQRQDGAAEQFHAGTLTGTPIS
jgi:hypothetical protein